MKRSFSTTLIAGAALIKGAKSQSLSSLGIGGPEVHVGQSGCADVRVPDDQAAIAMIRREIAVDRMRARLSPTLRFAAHHE